MKNTFNILWLAGAMGCFFTSCKKDEIKTVMQTGVPPAITLSPAAIVLTEAKALDTVATISWSTSNYGFKAAVSYTVQIAKAGTSFASPKEISMGSGTQLKYNGADLNQLALLKGLAPGSAGQLEIRIKSSLSDSLSIYSSAATLTVTPYLVIINYPSLWVPGEYQGWNAATAPKISSKLSNGVYEGYINITGSVLNFKYTSDPDWTHTTYGWASSTVTGNNVSGTFVVNGGNLFVPVAGYYLLKGNTNDKSWSGTKIDSWSMMGDFDGWVSDVDMTYNATTKVWTGTINMPAAGGFKFRANHDWAINYGDTGADLGLDLNGANIASPAGSHTVTLDLSVPGNYTYKVQ